MRFLSKFFFNLSDFKIILISVLCFLLVLSSLIYSKHHQLIKRDSIRYTISKNADVRQLDENANFKKFLNQHPVYLVMTSVPNRIGHLPEILNVLDKTWIKEIIISVPRKLDRTGQTYHIPKSLLEIEKVRILRTEKDYGPITKLLPALLDIKDKHENAIMIVIDDDHYYPRGLAQEFAYALWKSDKNTAFTGFIGAFGSHTRPPSVYEVDLDDLYDLWPDDNPQILHGAYGIGLFSNYIDTEWIQKALSFEKTLGRNDCFLADDLIISTALRQNDIKFSKLESEFYRFSRILPMEKNFLTNALHILPLADHQKPKKPHRLTCQVRLNNCIKTLNEFRSH